jgi:hypothetical protein
MDAQTVCETLKATPYKYTLASKFKDTIKTLPAEEQCTIIRQLHSETKIAIWISPRHYRKLWPT